MDFFDGSAMKTLMSQVRQFHEKFHCAIGNPERPDIRMQQELRISLIKEEYQELLEALDCNDPVATLDALADLSYVVAGAAIAWGLPLADALNEVHRSNMTKTPGQTRADGKVIKGPTYEPPDLQTVMQVPRDRALPRRSYLFHCPSCSRRHEIPFTLIDEDLKHSLGCVCGKTYNLQFNPLLTYAEPHESL